MCDVFGSSRPEQEAIPNPPSEKEMMDFINHVTGTQTVTVTGADGKKQRLTTRLPRTPEQQRALQAGEDLLITSLDDIQRLYKYDPRSVVNYAPLVQAVNNSNQETLQDLGQFANLGDIEQRKQQFREMNRTLVDEQFARERMSNEERLAHSGRGSGTYAAESRAAMARAQGLARQEGDTRAVMGAEDYAAKRLGTDAQAFGLRQGGRENTIAAVQNEYGLNKADEQDQEQRRLRAIQERGNQLKIGSDVVKYDDWKALQDRTQQDALGTYQAENAVQNQRYGIQVNAIQANNKAKMDEYNSRPPSFGEWAMGTAGRIGGAYLSGGMSELGGGGASAGGGGGFMPSTQGAYGPRVGRDTVGRMF
jgi:hypothetical protein